MAKVSTIRGWVCVHHRLGSWGGFLPLLPATGSTPDTTKSRSLLERVTPCLTLGFSEPVPSLVFRYFYCSLLEPSTTPENNSLRVASENSIPALEVCWTFAERTKCELRAKQKSNYTNFGETCAYSFRYSNSHRILLVTGMEGERLHWSIEAYPHY